MKDDDGNEILEVYEDDSVIGSCGVFNVETGEFTPGGNLMGRTLKVKTEAGEVRLEREWYPENL